jgi:hypothetical protein
MYKLTVEYQPHFDHYRITVKHKGKYRIETIWEHFAIKEFVAVTITNATSWMIKHGGF